MSNSKENSSIERGQQLKLELQSGIESRQSFTETAQQLNPKVKTFKTFKVDEAPSDLNRSVLEFAQNAKVLAVSIVLNLNGQGTFVYVSEKTLPEIAADDESLLSIQTYLNYIGARASMGSFVNELVARGMEPIAR